MGDSSGQMHGILAITQKLNFIENIYKKLNNFEMDGHLHKFLPELSLLSRRVESSRIWIKGVWAFLIPKVIIGLI